MTSHAAPSESAVTEGTREAVARARRGMWVATACAAAAAASAAVLVAVVLTTLEYDFGNGLLEPFAPLWRPAALLVFAIAWPVPVFSGWRAARWGAVAGLALGAVWLLFLAELAPGWLEAGLVAAACWGVAAFVLAALPAVGDFTTFQREQARVYAHSLGSLSAEADARRWIAVARAWGDAGVLSRRDRTRMAGALRTWAGGRAALDEELARGIDALAPPARRWGWRVPARLRRRWRVEPGE
jgi:hypothetical protein